jgi:hypothetical protein
MKKLFLPVFLLTIAIMACSISIETPTLAPSEPPSVTETTATTTISVYFQDVARYQVGTEPYEKAVTRTIPVPASLPEAVLTELFLGPTPAESAAGLAVVLSGTTGFSDFAVVNGVARIYLTGTCNSSGSTYTIANLIAANLAQFPEIQWIKIYDQNGQTETPDGQSGSIPFCLEP